MKVYRSIILDAPIEAAWAAVRAFDNVARWNPGVSAARLESACKQYSARILISENTYRKLHGTYRIREIDRVIVKGKTEPVSIYEVLDYHTEASFPNLMEAVLYFRDGLAQYRQGNWQPAIAAFGEVLKLHPSDSLAQVYIERCEHMMAHPPADDWDGVWVMHSK